MKNGSIPFNLQFFAEPAGDQGGQTPPSQPPAQTQQQTTVPEIDYDKLAQLVSGKQAVTEESVIKGYLKQQGLSKEQMDQAIATYKQQQEANKPDVTALKEQAWHLSHMDSGKRIFI